MAKLRFVEKQGTGRTSNIGKNVCPERIKKYEREIRIAMGHLQTVEYIASICV